MSAVALHRAAPSARGVQRAVSDAMEEIRWRERIERGAPVALKPNLGWDKLVPGAISGPWVVEAVVRVLAGHAGRIYLVEADQIVTRAEDALRMSGLDRVVAEHGLTWVNLSRGPFVRVRDDERLVLRDVAIPALLLETQLITLPVLKTHNKSIISGALKNQWGCLDVLRHNYHPVLSPALVDVNRIVRPRLAVMDGTVCLEGNGPKSGRPREVGVVLVSANLAGIDATAARVLGLDPAAIPHLALAEAHGLGSLSPPLTAASVSPLEVAVRLTPARHNLVSFAESALRRRYLERLVFRTRLLDLAAWSTRRYYDLWYTLVGRRACRRFLRASPYAAQWTRRVGGLPEAEPISGGPRSGCAAAEGATIVVPCFDEAGRLDGEQFRALLAHRGVRLLFVDDGSSDGTPAVLEELRVSGAGRIDVLTLARNQGKGEAVRAGLLAALERGAAIVGYTDADLATPVAELARLAATMQAEDVEVLLGARVLMLGARIERNPVRHYLGRVFATFASMALRLPVYDTQCGAKLFRRSPALEAALSRPFRSRWCFDVELLGRLRAPPAGVPPTELDLIREVPLRAWRNVPGSKLRPGGMIRAGAQILAILLRTLVRGDEAWWPPGSDRERAPSALQAAPTPGPGALVAHFGEGGDREA